jgi:hypothetical protein
MIIPTSRNRRKTSMFKLQVQDDENDARVWHDVKGPDGSVLTFDKEQDARARLEDLYPVLVKLERYSAGSKRTRVIAIITDDDDGWKR